MFSALIDRHPLIFTGRAPQASDVPAGWIELVDSMLTELEEALPTHALATLTITQLKEKYGSLRVGFFVAGDYHDAVDQIVDAASIASESLCMECGDAGKRGRGPGGIAVDCEFCKLESRLRSARRR
jgi:hypothetical protein